LQTVGVVSKSSPLKAAAPHANPLAVGGGASRLSDFEPALAHAELADRALVRAAALLESIEDYIVLPKLGHNAGVVGAIELAKLAAVDSR